MKKSLLMLAIISLGLIACDNEDGNSSIPQNQPQSPMTQNDATRELKIIEDTSKPYDSAAVAESLTKEEQKISHAMQDFSFQFMADILTMYADSSCMVFSPYSLSQVVGMLANGADGQSLMEMAGVLNLNPSDLQLLNVCNKKISNSLVAADTSMTMIEANALWLQYDFPIYRSFVNDMRNYYDAEVQAIDFNSSTAGQTINKWCAQKTKERINQIVNDGPLTFVSMLANALYIKGRWSTPFDKQMTHEQTFTAEDGTPSTVTMMMQRNSFQYVADDNCELAAMGMGNKSDFELIFGLPRKGVNLQECITTLDAARWSDMTSRMKSRKIQLEIPRFETSSQTDIRSLLEGRGIRMIFDKDNANFSHMSPLQTWIDKMEQKTFLRFDEKGCEAAAVTWAGMLGTMIPDEREYEWITFRLDRPFFFVIREKKSGTLLFIGAVNQIEMCTD